MNPKNSFLTTPMAILLSSFVISTAILMHGGVVKVGKPTQPTLAQPTATPQPYSAFQAAIDLLLK